MFLLLTMMSRQRDACLRYLLKKQSPRPWLQTSALPRNISIIMIIILFFCIARDKTSGINATFDLLAAIKARMPELPVLMTISSELSCAEAVRLAARAIRSGCAECRHETLATDNFRTTYRNFPAWPGTSLLWQANRKTIIVYIR